MNRRVLFVLIATAAAVGCVYLALATNSDTITVNYEVQAINELAIDATEVTLTINAATAGSQPDDDTDAATAKYAITTNAATDAKKITAAINTAMPSGVTLSVTLAAPTGATSSGVKSLSDTPENVVTAIEMVAESALVITFKLSATVSAGVVASAAKTLTLTLIDS
jgi:hypothetical protein